MLHQYGYADVLPTNAVYDLMLIEMNGNQNLYWFLAGSVWPNGGVAGLARLSMPMHQENVLRHATVRPACVVVENEGGGFPA